MPYVKQGPFVSLNPPAINAGHLNAIETQYDNAMADVAAAYATKGNAIDPSNVGYDIILLAGQSNMTGSGVAAPENKWLDPWNPRIYQYAGSGANANTIIAGIDPLFHYLPAGSVGPGVGFAKEYLKTVPNNRTVLFVPTARGATGFSVRADQGTTYSWDPADVTAQVNLYNFTIAQMDAAIAAAGPNSRVVAFLWLQGENDEGYLTQSQYAAKLDSLISGLRTRYGATIPFVVGQMLPDGIAATGTNAAVINSAHIDTPRRNTLSAFAYGPSGSYNPDVPPIHYSTPAQRILGKNFWDAYNRFALVNVTGSVPASPGAVTLTQSGTTVNVAWVRTPSRWTDYLVEYNTGSGWTTLTRAQSIELTATITGISLGTTIQVRVSAINETGTSAPSAVASLTLVNLPAQVTGLTAGTSTMYSQPLSWAAASGATSYKIEYAISGSGTWVTANTTTGTSFTVAGLSANTAYDYRVSGVNAGGTGTASSTVTNSTQAFTALRTVVGVAPTAAYSLRKLDTAYAGKAINVRRSSDNTTSDIGFTASGDLDTATLLTFAGSGSAYVTTWYDQSGNGVNVTQATQANQPRIVNAGVVETVNGRPSIMFLGGPNSLSAAASTSALAGCTIMAVAEHTTSSTLEQDLYAESNNSTSAKYAPFAQFANSLAYSAVFINDAATSLATGGPSGAYDTTLGQLSYVDPNSTTVTYYKNGATNGTATVNASRGTATMQTRYVGSRGSSSGHNGHIAELVVYYTQPTSTQRQAGEANEKSYYSTP
jgi:hypothetical protein